MDYDAEAVVFDLDGTLVRLAVDWDAVAADVAAALRERGVEPRSDLWSNLGYADEVGHRSLVEDVIADHECEGARRSTRLATADDLPLSVPVGVCSLNAERACRTALEAHDLAAHVGPVIGRDSVGGPYKPDPEPLLAAVRDLGVAPGDALFVGDSERDAVAAERAGVPFRYV
jgi:phosphoglycolate phosphatase